MVSDFEFIRSDSIAAQVLRVQEAQRSTDPQTFEASRKATATAGLRSLASLSLGAGRLGRLGRFGLQELQVKWNEKMGDKKIMRKM